MHSSDVFSEAKRSAVMRAVKGANTRPEIALRKALFARGYRYRLHGGLPGRPDLVFAGRRAVIFVHGCFWHGHGCPRGAREPKANAEYWRAKRLANKARDRNVTSALRLAGWRVLIVWECTLGDIERAATRAAKWLA